MRILNITRWPAFLVFVAAGLLAVSSAFATVNLFGQTMANIAFLRRAGFEAVRLGALGQLFWLTLWGMTALACFLGFKVCEVELVQRYRNWARPQGPGSDGV
ncbi:MAG: hypothetical protein ABI832_21770 [bacterium]